MIKSYSEKENKILKFEKFRKVFPAIIIMASILIVGMGYLLFNIINDEISKNMNINVEKAANNKVLTNIIGVTVLDLSNPYYSQFVNGIREQAKSRGITLQIEDPKSDVDKQIKAVEKFIENKVDAIIIAALDQEALEPVLLKARLQNIKVVAQATKVENSDIYVSFDEWEMGHTIGQAAGKWIKEKLNGNAQVAILNYPRISQIKNREKGILDGILQFAPNAKIVATMSASNQDEGKKATQEILKKFPDVKVLVGINDGGALGGMQAFEEKGITGNDIFIGGIDATSLAIDKIRKGTIYRNTVDIDPFYSGKLDVEFAIKLIRGSIVPSKYSQNTKLIGINNVDIIAN